MNKAWMGRMTYQNGRTTFFVGFTSDTCTLQEFLDWYGETGRWRGILIVISDREVIEVNRFKTGEVTRWTAGDCSEMP